MSIFFMLSGYLLALTYMESKKSKKDYVKNRIARIYPVYFAAGLITLPWLGIEFGQTWETIGTGAAKAFFIFIANLFLIQAWFPQLFSYWNNGGSWSISVEMFCYAILPILAPYMIRLSKRGIIFTIGGLYLVALMPGLAAKLYEGYGIPVYYAMPIFRLPEFLIGICIHLFLKNWQAPRFIGLIQLPALAVLFLYLGIVGGWMPIYIGHHWIVLPIIAFTLYTLSLGQGPLAWFLSKAPLIWLGKISYCFYSFQALIGLSLMSFHEPLMAAIPALTNAKLLALLAFLSLTLLSAAGYYLIEEPARKLIKNTNIKTN